MLEIKTMKLSGFILHFTDLAQVSWIPVFVEAESEEGETMEEGDKAPYGDKHPGGSA